MYIQPTAGSIIKRITNPIIKASNIEKKELYKALGLRHLMSKNWRIGFESHGGDIISGEMLPNISVTSKGISPMETIGNIINVELARIRGQLKKVSTEDLKL